MSKVAVQFTDVSFEYNSDSGIDSKLILDKFNLQVKDGEFVSIIGPSGSGKSTIFRLISGLERPNKGEILINGVANGSRLGRVGYMPQQDLLMPWRTAVENAALPLELKGIKKEQASDMVLGLLEEFGLAGIENKYPSDLSGGMKQRVSFLRTILTGANVLLLDEPFSALDAITRLSMQEWLLEQWERRKKSVIFVTHDVDEALFLSDRIFVFDQQPVSELQEVKVPIKRPRSGRDLNNPKIIQLKEYLIDQLRSKVKL